MLINFKPTQDPKIITSHLKSLLSIGYKNQLVCQTHDEVETIKRTMKSLDIN